MGFFQSNLILQLRFNDRFLNDSCSSPKCLAKPLISQRKNHERIQHRKREMENRGDDKRSSLMSKWPARFSLSQRPSILVLNQTCNLLHPHLRLLSLSILWSSIIVLSLIIGNNEALYSTIFIITMDFHYDKREDSSMYPLDFGLWNLVHRSSFSSHQRLLLVRPICFERTTLFLQTIGCCIAYLREIHTCR